MVRTPSRSGFTLYELIVVVSIIGILTSITLPSLTKAREEARKGQIKTVLGQAIAELQLYLLENMEYPATTEDFGRWLEQALPATFDWDEAEMRICIKGFDYELVIVQSEQFGMLLCARPKPPKESGSFVLCIDQNGDIVEDLPDEEALELERMRTAVARARALHGIARVASMQEEPEAAEYLLSLLETSDARKFVWAVLDGNHDGRVDVFEVRELSEPQTGDSPVVAELKKTLRDLLAIHDLDDGTSDQLSISLEDYRDQPWDSMELFDVSNIDLWTEGMFSSDGVHNSSLVKFAAAQDARERGDWDLSAEIMQAERNELRAQQDKTIRTEYVELLIPTTHILSPRELSAE